MEHVRNLMVRTLTITALIAGSMAFAQTLAVTPSNDPSITVGSTQQFTATPAGYTISVLSWYVAGQQGGNAANGTITANGLYTAPPSVPAANPVVVTAITTATTGKIYLKAVSISIVPVSSQYTLTVGYGTGSGQYAAGTRVTIAANAPPTAGEIFAGWSGATVASPTATSTTLIMPAANTSVIATYGNTLTVVNGTGSGTYAAGTVVTITANSPPAGESFSIWSGATVANAAASPTTITISGDINLTVTAQFAGPVITQVSPNPMPAGTVAVTVTGTGFLPGATVWDNGAQLTTHQPTANTLTVSDWHAASTTSATLTVHNPGPAISNAVVVPVGAPQYTLTVVNGSGSGSYAAGTVVTITANAAASGQNFTNWTGTGVTNANAPSTTITMPAANTTVTANYTAGPPTYTLTVSGGSGSGSYTAGTVVTIVANSAPSGEVFLDWTGATVANSGAASTTITMPATNTAVTAQFGNPPPVLLSVSPNPLPQGTSAVTVTGTGFVPGSQIWQGGVQLTTQYVSNATLTCSVWFPTGAGTTSTAFSVENPGPVFSNSLTIPVSGPPTYALTVVNGSGSGTYTAGMEVSITANAPPAGQSFANWSGATVASANQPTTSITMPAASVTVTANFITPAPIPFPVTTHPRLWIAAADLPRLQSWANSNNPVYVAQTSALATAVANYNQFFPGAALSNPNPTPANPYPDPGDAQGYDLLLTEDNMVILAFSSLIDPNPANRINYAQAARNLLMNAINQAALGHLSGAPFRDPQFATYNRASSSGHEWPLTVDWIYNATDANNNPILTAADKAAIQNVFMQWSNDDLSANTTGGDNPGPAGLIDSLALLPGNLPYRMASNNYYLAHARNLTMMSLVLDPADDPPVNAAVAASTIGNTERSYIADATGAWLYEEFAMMGDPAVVAAAYHVPNNPTGAGFGLASGGLPPEGYLYGESFAYALGQLLALQTAGFNNPSYSGPQIGLIGAPVWDRYVTGYISSLTPTAQVFPQEPWNGPLYQFAGYGDMLREYVTPDMMRPFALLSLLEQENQSVNSVHLNAARWFAGNVLSGGPANFLTNVGNPWTWGVADSFLTFMLFDPSAAAATDPRPNFPTLFYDAPASRIVAHSDWTPTGTMFTYKAGWTSINHQQDNAGQFELMRKGQWLTKEMSNYDNGGDGNGVTTEYHNTLALQNWSVNGPGGPAGLQSVDTFEWTNGSQWMLGQSAGDPSTITSNGPGYVYASSNLTNLYNLPNQYSAAEAATDVTQATRSVLWLNNASSNVNGSDFIVVYDRATTQHSGLFKYFNLCLVTAPTTQLNANGVTAATEVLTTGEQLFIQTLLPQNAAASYFNGAALLNPVADTEPTQFVYQVQNPTNPSDVRFLHVLQGSDAGTQMVAASYVQSASGTPFDGALFGSSAVFFPQSATVPFAGVTLTLPASVQTLLVAGLTPGAGYTVTVANGVVTISAGGTSAADSAGLLTVTL
jgi:hypothetical protein